jgi:hypothetical protein
MRSECLFLLLLFIVVVVFVFHGRDRETRRDETFLKVLSSCSSYQATAARLPPNAVPASTMNRRSRRALGRTRHGRCASALLEASTAFSRFDGCSRTDTLPGGAKLVSEPSVCGGIATPLAMSLGAVRVSPDLSDTRLTFCEGHGAQTTALSRVLEIAGCDMCQCGHCVSSRCCSRNTGFAMSGECARLCLRRQLIEARPYRNDGSHLASVSLCYDRHANTRVEGDRGTGAGAKQR